MRITSLMAAGTMALAVAACGDDVTEQPNCDASQLGHGEVLPEECNAAVSPFSLDEGGELRIFVARRPIPDVRNNWFQATFYKDQTPAKRPFLSTVTFNDECMNFTPEVAGALFDAGPTPQHQQIADTRTYVDVGANVVVTAGGRDWTLEKMPDAADPYNGVTQDILYLGNARTMLSNDTAGVPVGSEFTTNLEGLTNGVALDGSMAPAEAALHIPADFDITSHDFSQVQRLTRGQDYTFTYTGANASENYSLFFINPDTNIISTLCTGKADGSITVPAAGIDLVANTLPNGQIGVGKFVHRAYDMDGRRVDLLGMNCIFTDYTFDP